MGLYDAVSMVWVCMMLCVWDEVCMVWVYMMLCLWYSVCDAVSIVSACTSISLIMIDEIIFIFIIRSS